MTPARPSQTPARAHARPGQPARRRLGLGLLLLGLASLASLGHAQTPPAPGIALGITLNRTSYLFNQPSDPIQVKINLANVSGAERLVTKGLTATPLHLQLVFTDPAGRLIATTQQTTGGPDAPPAPTLLVGDQYVQVEAIEHLAAGGGVTVPVADAKAFYGLPQAGFYSVKAYVSFATYPAVYRTEPDGTEFARLDTATFAGVLESNRVPFALTTDADGDGYAFPVPDSRISPQTVADCNDANPAVHPGAPEVPDGIDNDCNAATLDDTVPPTLTTPAVTVNATSPAGAVVPYTVTVTDNVDPHPTLSCSPPSGALFPIGLTTVTCVATDQAGNVRTQPFSVTVTSGTTQIDALIAKVNGLTGVSTKLKTDLIGKLTDAKTKLAQNKLADACQKLTDFITKVNAESGKGLTVAQANELRTDATRIKAVLGCP